MGVFRVIHAEGDVPCDGVGEQEVILGYVSAAVPDGADGHIVHVLAVDEDGPVRYIVGPQNQVHQGGLAGAGLANNTHVFAGLDGEGNVLQSVVFPVGVTEGQIPELDVAMDRANVGNVLPVVDILLGVQQFADTPQRCLATAGHVDQLGHGHNGPDNCVEVADEFH